MTVSPASYPGGRRIEHVFDSRPTVRSASDTRQDRRPCPARRYRLRVTDAPPLLAVVPNFSEGRRADVIEAIVGALRVPGARLVYRQADPDHNRLDTTVLGDADAVRRSAMAGAATAARLIDMDEHRGSHPRMGAVDVIPFMPVRGVSMDEVVELARGFGKELAETLDLPVYLYDRAALSPERHSLADVRRGEYEGLRDAVARGERLPDFGPHRIGKAGAVAVGARKPLIAFNVYLDGTDEAAAKDIARRVRASSGGLPAVRAIGFSVPERGGAVTVSMNLVDAEVTGLRTAFDAVAREAAARGLNVTSSEIVGLVPASAIDEDDVGHLRLEGFDADAQILERLVNGGGGA
jgi:glutamate formiminotransferase / 5-formyltetrahydrofolate cyclo-ligase